MIRLVQMSGGSGHELEMFTRGNNYFVLDGVITDDANQKHNVCGTNLFLYSTGYSFYVYTTEEVQSILDAYEEQFDGLATVEEAAYVDALRSVIYSMETL